MTTPSPLPIHAGVARIEPLENPVIISDLHLSDKNPALLMGFMKFLETVAPRYKELIILGDFFDFWIGDDAMAQAQPIIAQLQYYTSLGHRLYIMQGNRDVMLGEDFARACGGTLIQDPIKVNIKGRDILLSHGDAWCLLDKRYQQFRAMVRNPLWQQAALSKSVQERIRMANQARQQSEETKTVKSAARMDVVESAVHEAARQYGVDVVIHGHTHKPAAHVAGAIERYVVPNWELTPTQQMSGYITFLDGGRPQIQKF